MADMSCTTLNRSQLHNPIVPALILAAFVMAALIYTSHAVLQHGQYAEQVRQCLENQPPVLQLQNPLTGRTAKVCPLRDHFGIQIVEKDGQTEVTSFPNKSKTLEQVIRYLWNANYTAVIP